MNQTTTTDAATILRDALTDEFIDNACYGFGFRDFPTAVQYDRAIVRAVFSKLAAPILQEAKAEQVGRFQYVEPLRGSVFFPPKPEPYAEDHLKPTKAAGVSPSVTSAPYAYEFWDADDPKGRAKSLLAFGPADPAHKPGQKDYQGHVWVSMPLYTHPAPTTPATGCIGDDAKFVALLDNYAQNGTDGYLLCLARIAAYVNRWADARSPVAAAPDLILTGITGSSNNTERARALCRHCGTDLGARDAALAAAPAQVAQIGATTDTERLDWLDQQGVAYGFENLHEGNRWEIDGAFANLRNAIDSAKRAENGSK